MRRGKYMRRCVKGHWLEVKGELKDIWSKYMPTDTQWPLQVNFDFSRAYEVVPVLCVGHCGDEARFPLFVLRMLLWVPSSLSISPTLASTPDARSASCLTGQRSRTARRPPSWTWRTAMSSKCGPDDLVAWQQERLTLERRWQTERPGSAVSRQPRTAVTATV